MNLLKSHFKISRMRVAFLAGFYEGEGHICKTASNSVQICISQNCKYLLYELKRVFGGKITTGGSSPSFKWYRYGEPAKMIASLFYPHLSPRRKKQMRKALH